MSMPYQFRCRATLLGSLSLIVGGRLALPAPPQDVSKPPVTNRVDHVDEYHGVRVPDPYRWLEDDVRTSPAVKVWVEAQNKVTFGYLEAIPQREILRNRLTELWNFEKFTVPAKHGGKYYFSRNDGLQNQFVLYEQDTLESDPSVLLDPNTWSEDGTLALAGTSFSNDGHLLAFGVTESGSDWNTWRVMHVATRQVLADELKWLKFSSVSWLKDGTGFFYSRYDEPRPGATFQELNLNQKVFLHRVGASQSDDELVYCRPDEPTWGFTTQVTEDGCYAVITVWKGTDDKYRILYKSLTEADAAFVELIDNFDSEYAFIGNDGPVFYFKTDRDAPRKRIIAIDTERPERDGWREIVAQAEDTLTDVELVNNQLIANYLHNAKTQVKIYSLEGGLVREVGLPGIGSATGFGGKREHTETFYLFSNYAMPPRIYRYDLKTHEQKLLRQASVDFKSDDYEVRQVFYPSKDGTRVPMFITQRRGIMLDGNHPTLLYGYGGFNIALTPGFSISRAAWLELGGVLAVANLRGGGEFGEEWHQAGTKLKKQNVFDDFIAAAEWLIANGYTKPAKLAIQGGSNGGLLVGACMTQRPDLFGACLPAVGVMDMLRFHKFTSGRFWVDDYGSSDQFAEFKALLAYSPYHNLRAGWQYPATLVTTADTDDRVVPSHSFKFAAALQAVQSGPAPTLIRIETRAGHGAGTPTAKIIEETADQFAFLVKTLDMNVKVP